MITLGIRAEPQKATFVIFDNEANKIVNIESIIIPSTFNLPEKLKFARNSILDILREFKATSAGIKVAEGNSQNQDADRLYLEAVFMESFASSNIENYYVGRKTSISSKLAITTKFYDEIINGRDPFREIEGWPTTKSSIVREAILVAMVASQ